MHYINGLFHEYPEVAVYLTLAIGFWFGALKFGKFSLGVVTSTLIAGLLIGQFHVTIPSVMQAMFFDMFLFAVGYSVGPQFIRAIRSDGLPQVVLTLFVCLSGLLTAIVLGKWLNYGGPMTAGLLAGGYTNSTVLGVASSLVHQNKAITDAAAALIPVAYAVTYPFGTAGSAWFLTSVAPKLFGVNLEEACKDYEAQHGTAKISNSAYRAYTSRSYELTSDTFWNKTVSDVEACFDHEVSIRRMRTHQGSEIIECDGSTLLTPNAIISVSGPLSSIVKYQAAIGREIKDEDLLDYAIEQLDIVVLNKKLFGKSLGDLVAEFLGRPGHGLFLTGVTRADVAVAPDMSMSLQRGDVLSVRGPSSDVERLASSVGYSDRPKEGSDMAFMSFGIVIGCLIGAITLHFHGIPLSFGTSVGAIVAGIVCGYMRATKRTFGRIPAPAVWVFNNVGLNGFIAIIGLNAAPGFISGLQHYGLALFVSGIAITLVPLIVGLVLGKYVFKFHPGILFGVCAGARSTTAALGALESAAKSHVPAIGYTVGYAVSRLVMAVLTIVLLNVF
ncbi:aspartate:alanine exchanger family transporter [Pantoea cypripedii]|uniref:Aspartate-alanine antiporter n=1 Tax=Pantoea cypripedii TaxID=55209 RepID=A0A1X1EKQ9_PANCY|nr:TrkA C-terminal domain-containing protein [Pantoea cypripedii]MBP2198803.1 putative transport protein [Pantoea cypripedii]ORM89517.1 aspartate-alanine antiporter [Pantoea cypripedii]